MRPARTLPALALVLALLFHAALAQDTTGARSGATPVDPGRRARTKAIAISRAQNQGLSPLDTVTLAVPNYDDRGDYHGRGRDTGGAIVLKRAGELRQIQEPQGEVVELERNVKIVQDSMTMWCNRARHRRNQGILELYGDVLMIDPQRSLNADEVFYYERPQRSVARGNVVIERDSVVLTCEQAQYDEINDHATFDRNVLMRDVARDVVLNGASGSYYSERQFARVPEEPVLVRLDSAGVEEARIVGLYMEYDALNGVAEARDSVRISWKQVLGFGDKLFFYPDSSRALLVGDPRVLHDRDEVLGDSVWLYMNEDALDSAVVIGNAVAYTPSDSLGITPRSSLRGKRIVLDFEAGEVKRMISRGQAIGIYHVYQEGRDQGSNRVSGDVVVLTIRQGSLHQVDVTGGTEGTFYPPQLAEPLRND